MSAPARYTGGCHCGAVRFAVTVTDHTALACNCSVCRMKGFVHVIVPRDRFDLLAGEAALTTYTFNTHTARHTFCKVCGVQSFYVPRSHPDGVSVNLSCLDGGAPTRFEVVPFDGASWEANIDTIC